MDLKLKQARIFVWNSRHFLIGLSIGFFMCLTFIFNTRVKGDYEEVKTSSVFISQELAEKTGLKEVRKFSSDAYMKANVCNYGKSGPRILCAVYTYKKNHASRALMVHKTWGKRCDKIIYMTGPHNYTVEDPEELNLVNLNITDSYAKLTDKTIGTLNYVYKNLMDDFDWLIKADDDTYVIMENLKAFLVDKCPDELYTYGFLYSPKAPERFLFDFNSGGAGYLLSNRAINSFGQKYKEDLSYCRNTTGAEDVDITVCLKEIGVKPADSRDRFGKERFHPLSFKNMWSMTQEEWTFKHSKYPIKLGEDCCSDSSISFHYTPNEEMQQMEFLLYKLKHYDYKLFNLEYFNYFLI